MPYSTVRKPYERVRQQITFPGESKTDRSFGNDTDVNNIVARFARTGDIPQPLGNEQYCDVTGLQGDLTEMIENSRKAISELQEQEREFNQKEQKQNEENATKLKALEAQLEALQTAAEPAAE